MTEKEEIWEHEKTSLHEIDKDGQDDYYTSKDVQKYIKMSFIDELRQNKATRFKFILSFCATFAYSTLGWCKGQTGPAFLDILHISGTDLEKGSVFMTSYSTGCAIGSLIGGTLYSRVNRYIILVVALLIYSLTRALIPWCFLYELMVTAHGVHGLCGGLISVVMTSTAVSIWGATPRGRVYLNIFLVSDGAAGLISPIATSPFLLPRSTGVAKRFDSLDTPNNNTATTNPLIFGGNNSDISSIPHTNITHTETQTSQIYIAYTVSAGLVLLSTIPFIVMCFKSSKHETKNRSNDESQFIGNLPSSIQRLQLVNVGLFATFYMSVNYIFTGYLPAFCVQHLQWTKITAAWLTSELFLAMLGGRLFGAYLSHFFKPMRLLSSSVVLHVIGLTGLSISGIFMAAAGVWIFVFSIGAAWGLIWPSLLSWTNENLIPVRGKVTAFILLMGYAGTLLSPLLFGYMMEEISPLWFCYLNLGYACITVINVLLVFVYTNSLKPKDQNDICLNVNLDK
ncbi:sodium-dependent glucose transporter 1A-like [Argopecten irradians]|uniref:sodium-dependent glucose transporter 1A-like n=1 Tax=Argopecten irradians TaxID=31199 RepID=UPI003711DE1B